MALGQGNYAVARDLFIASMERQHARGNISGVAEGVFGLAALAAAENQLERAAKLFGAAHAIREHEHGPVWPAEQFEIERHTAVVRARLPAPIFEQHWHAGQQFSLDQAIAYAHEDEPSDGVQIPSSPRLDGLTAREREVAALVAQGCSNRVIAERLVISERTVEHHIANILAKLDVASRVQVATWAVAAGLANLTV